MSEQSPEPLTSGQFSLYQTPDGGYLIALRLEDEAEDRHIPVPPMLLRMMPGGKKGVAQMLASLKVGV